ncbi:hypothetical protein EDD22DRAFT_846627 [Suillus occidentalis]|nr:hypothetical protein EDD22DRAFT_846627 [Suillus occidentalis]
MSRSCSETIQEYSLIGPYWSMLNSCRHSVSLECTAQLPSPYKVRCVYGTLIDNDRFGSCALATASLVVVIGFLRQCIMRCCNYRDSLVVFATGANNQRSSCGDWHGCARLSQYHVQDGLSGQFYTAAPGAVVGNFYTISMLAVLNARKFIRERERLAHNLTELPTIR